MDDFYRLMSDENIRKVQKYIGPCDIWRTRSGCEVFKAVDGGKVHISVSHKDRLPTYYEMKRIRYDLAPEVPYMAMIFPPKSEFVNIDNNCLHLWEIDGAQQVK